MGEARFTPQIRSVPDEESPLLERVACDSSERPFVHGKRPSDSGPRPLASKKRPFDHWQRSDANGQRPSATKKRSFANRQRSSARENRSFVDEQRASPGDRWPFSRSPSRWVEPAPDIPRKTSPGTRNERRPNR